MGERNDGFKVFTIEIPVSSIGNISEVFMDNEDSEIIDSQEEVIEALLEEIEEYEEEIEDLEELIDKQGKALRDKDKFIEMLERVIEKQHINRMNRVIDYIDIEGLEEDLGLSLGMTTDSDGDIRILLSEEVMGMDEVFDYFED